MKKLIFPVLLLIMFGCNSNDPELNDPVPVADFSYSPTTIRDGQSIQFVNLSIDAYSYKWDFGNNITSIKENPLQTFTQGTWTVKLTAINAQDKKHVVSKTINVLPAYKSLTVTKYTINKIAFTTSNGSGWDSSTGPDIYLYFADYITNDKFFETGYVMDLKPINVPYYVIVNIPFTSITKKYYIFMYDYDGIGDDVMEQFTFDIPSLIPSYPSTVKLIEGSFEITLSLTWNT